MNAIPILSPFGQILPMLQSSSETLLPAVLQEALQGAWLPFVQSLSLPQCPQSPPFQLLALLSHPIKGGFLISLTWP